MKKLLPIAAILLSVTILAAWAQNAQPTAVLQYFDNPSQVTITDSNGNPVTNIYYGMDLPPGYTVRTAASTAEIQLDPNGSILKLADNTNFTIQTLQGAGGETVNAFSLLAGRLRTIAAHTTTGNYKYSIQTPTAVCGVRGTDFTLDVVPGKLDAVGVLTGVVNFVDTVNGKSINVDTGMYANTFASSFQAVRMTSAQMNELFGQMTFEKLNPNGVPGHSGEIARTQAETPPATQPLPEQPQAPEKSVGSSKPNPFFNFLQNHLGMQIGTITINGITYSKAVLQPQFTIGKLRMALYLPVIYQTNIFDPSTWYRPGGNNEWDFGLGPQFANAPPLKRVEDAASDLMLKIRYLEWGRQTDPFYLKVGNLSNMTIGQGLLMYNYANNQDFPAIRRIGLNMGIDLGRVGFEAVVNDLADPQIFGGRAYVQPLGRGFLSPELGFSAIADISPASDFISSGASNLYGNPIFIAFGPDIGVPFITTGNLSLLAFADVGGMIPYFRDPVSNGTTTVPAGLYTKAFYDTSNGTVTLRNYGIAGGLLGRVSGLDWRLEYRYSKGVFQPSMFNSTYNRTRAQDVVDMANYVLDPTNPAYDGAVMGIYGQAGTTIGKVVEFEAGYFWPWATATNPGSLTNDYLHLKLALKRGIIPGFGISGSLSYDRSDFVPTLLKQSSAQGLTLFDAHTTVKAEVDYPIAPTLDLALIYTTAVVHNPQTGAVEMDPSDPNLPQVKGSISIETRVHF